MENVTIVGTEDDLLILATGSGERFALAIDDVLQREIRRARRRNADEAPRVTVSPREIQAHIRSGLSAAETAELLGIGVDDVARFEGPVLAEREHIVGQALAVPVLIGSEVEPDAQPTFGAAIRAKLADLNASAERWASWKGDSGWIVKLEFTAAEVSHDARWSFDPRHSALSPLNADATQLSRQGSLPEGLIPRLRAVEGARQESPYKDDSRFDSGAFGPRLLPPQETVDEPALPERSDPAAQNAATNRAPDQSTTSPETADLLEALRRRRGQRESAPLVSDFDDDAQQSSHASSPIALFDSFGADSDIDSDDERDEKPAPEPQDTSSRRRRRNAMPSWDEIVFGARTDD
ncbi:septation protein SepH [Microbacterium aerolatum]|uniref:septation protein SepH n=1 Tax=Microbacterium aerolatum TaxID=153731 RepID=UPI00384A7E79